MILKINQIFFKVKNQMIIVYSITLPIIKKDCQPFIQSSISKVKADQAEME